MATEVRPTAHCSTNYVAPPPILWVEVGQPWLRLCFQTVSNTWFFLSLYPILKVLFLSACFSLAAKASLLWACPRVHLLASCLRAALYMKQDNVRIRQAGILSTFTRTRNQRAVGELPRDDCAYSHTYIVLRSTFKVESCFALFVCLSVCLLDRVFVWRLILVSFRSGVSCSI